MTVLVFNKPKCDCTHEEKMSREQEPITWMEAPGNGLLVVKVLLNMFPMAPIHTLLR